MSTNQRLYSVAAVTCLVIVLLCMSYADSAAIEKRAIEETSDVSRPKVKICHKSTACAWVSYNPYSKQEKQYLENTCKCPENHDCVQTEHNLRQKTWVYKCRERIPPRETNLQSVSS